MMSKNRDVFLNKAYTILPTLCIRQMASWWFMSSGLRCYVVRWAVHVIKAQEDCLTLTRKKLWSFKTSWTTHRMTQHTSHMAWNFRSTAVRKLNLENDTLLCRMFYITQSRQNIWDLFIKYEHQQNNSKAWIHN